MCPAVLAFTISDPFINAAADFNKIVLVLEKI